MKTLNEKFTDVFVSMEEDKKKWMEWQKKCDDFRDAAIECTSRKIEAIIAEFVRDLKDTQDEDKAKKELDTFFANSEIDDDLKAMVAVQLMVAIDNLTIKTKMN